VIGLVSSTCLSRISSAVSISMSSSSSMVGNGCLYIFRFSSTTRVVVVVFCPVDVALSTYICARKRAHLVAPSISSRFFSRFLNPSTDRNNEWTDGVLSFWSPVRLDLCFAPIAAWSCFSNAYRLSCIFLSSAGYAGGFASAMC
jgi:hypothetical protein